MEETISKNKTKAKGNYLTGIIGAIIGGAIATVPWILVYLYGNMLLSILAVLIAAGELYGYKLLKGKMTKITPVILMILAVVIVSIATLLVIPTIMLNNQGINVNTNTIQALYQNESFKSGIIHDFVMSVVFTIIGASVITANVKKQIQESQTGEIDLDNDEEVTKIKKESIEKIKPIFEKFNSLDKEHGVMKNELMAEIQDKPELKTAFSHLKTFGIIKTSKGKYYYSVDNEEKQNKPKRSKKIEGIVIIAIVAVAIISITAGIIKGTKTKEVSDETVKFEISEKWTEYTNTYETGWNYYRYINTIPPIKENTVNTGTIAEYSQYPAYLNISHYEVDQEEIRTIEDIKGSIKEYIESLEVEPETYEEEVTKTKNGYDMLTIKMYIKEEPEQIEYLYYILNGKEMISIDTYSFNMKDEEEIKENAQKIIDTLKWKE